MGDHDRIGFIGLGIMGRPMAARLVRAGLPVVVHNRSQEAVEALAAEGAEAAGSPWEVAERSDIVVTMLPDSPDVEAVVLGEDGVIAGVREGMLVVDMSTIAPATARAVHAALAERGVEAVDAPVSGGEPAAVDGQLSIMAGGSQDAVQRAEPIFAELGKATTHIGPPGAGQVAKAANQVVVALTIQAVAEALTLSDRAGVDPARVREALLGGFAQSKILEAHGERMLEDRFDPGFRIELHRKDLAIALQTAREDGVALLATAQVAELLNALIAQGSGGRDHSALVTLYRELSGGYPDNSPSAAASA
jgi:2-hydroxy-3-oxopropionate reductase